MALSLAVHYRWWRGPNALSRRKWGRILLVMLAGLATLAFVLESQTINSRLPIRLFAVLHTSGLAWALISLTIYIAQTADGVLVWIFSRFHRKAAVADHPESPGRRKVLQAVRGAIYAAPVVALGYGTFIERGDYHVNEISIPVAGLHPDLEGLRIVQITDIHMGAFLSERDMERIVGMANDTRADLALMTGDLITRTGDPVEVCLKQLARVKADAGMIGCLGNHEIYAGIEDYVEQRGARLGIDFLRSRNRVMEFRGHKLNFAGVDYQRRGSPYLVGTERLIVPGMTNILLSHNPDVFPVAARQGFPLTISGHTHGGQITVEYLEQFVNPARFVTPYVSGLYAEGGKRVYVSRGLGTVGVPTRIGAPPELSVIRLTASSKVPGLEGSV
ncbi:MAG TPA: metallophosphoesterase [Bryobacteraceae bacterium]